MDEFDGHLQERASRSRRRGGRRLLALLRMVLVIGVAALFVLVTWRGGFLAILAWVFTIIILVDTSVNVLFGLYGVEQSRLLGFLFWVATVFLGTKAVLFVTKEGQVKTYRPAGPLASIFARLGAPGVVVVDNGVAAVFERSGRYTRVVGPGVVYTQRFERVAHVVDLRRQVRSRPVEQVMTRDGLSFDVERLDVLFEVAADFNPQRGEYTYSEEAVLDLVYRGGMIYDKGQEIDWQDRVLAAVEYHLRNVAANYGLAEVVRGDEASARKRLLEEVEKQARPALRQFGVHLVGIDMGQIIVPAELRNVLTLPLKQVVDLGWAHTQRDTLIDISEGIKKAIATIEQGMPADAGQTRPHLLLSLAETLRQILEQSLRLVPTAYRELPEARPLLPDSEGTAEERSSDAQGRGPSVPPS